jgi:hypothetical protein
MNNSQSNSRYKKLVNVRISEEMYKSYKEICRVNGFTIAGRLRKFIENDYKLLNSWINKSKDEEERQLRERIKEIELEKEKKKK